MAKRKAAEAAAETEPAPKDYTVLARRYRPQQFADLVGQEPVAQALQNALQSGRVAHAYLFTGARGVGKTSTARILARSLNCVRGPTNAPCGTCDACRAIAAGEDVDVLEIDGASNRGIDEVREIRANVQYRPSRSRYKIYIIDEVHMLTTPAFNALLKTLEEPPPHVKFIFATTEANKIPVTILSRCQRFDFAGISLPRLVERLRQIVTAEKMQADDEALQLVARRAGGSMRDAQSLLDQLLAFDGERLTVERVHQLLGTAHEERVAALAAAALQRDPRRALELLGAIVNQGQQLGELLDQLIEYWRDLLVVRCAGIDGQDLSVSGAQRQQLKEQAGRLHLDTILAGLDVLVGAKSRMRLTSHGRVLLEMALVRLSQLDDLVSLAQLAQWVQHEGSAPAPAPARPRAGAPAAPIRGNVPTSAGEASEKKKPDPGSLTAEAAPALLLRSENLDTLWSKVLSDVGFAVAGDLKKVLSLAILGPNTLVLRVSQRYNGTGNGGSPLDPSRLAKVEEALRKFTGQPCGVRVEYVKDEEAAPPQTGARGTASGTLTPGRQQKAELMQQPLVQKAIDLLGAQIVRADEGFGTPHDGAQTAPTDTDEEA